MKECLFNTYSNNCCAYCMYHRKSITPKQMDAKECLKKQCKHFIKNEDHQIWRQRERTKQKRKARKQRINDYVYAVSGGSV